MSTDDDTDTYARPYQRPPLEGGRLILDFFSRLVATFLGVLFALLVWGAMLAASLERALNPDREVGTARTPAGRR